MKKDKLILIVEKLFPELNILERDNFQIFQNKFESHLANFKNDKIEYLLDKFSELEHVGKEIAEKGFTTTFDLGQIGFNDDRKKFYSDLKVQMKKVHQYLGSLYKLHRESKEENLKNYFKNNNLDTVISDPIKLKLTQTEILGIVEGVFQVFSKEKISSTKLFKFCSNNFSSINSKSDFQTFNSYKESYYGSLNIIGNKTGKHKVGYEKEKIIQKLEMIISHINTN